MKKKIVGIFVCTLLIAAAVLPVAGNLNKEFIKRKNSITGDSNSEDTEFLNKQPTTEVYNKKLEKPLDRAYEDMITKVQQTTDGGYIAFGITQTYGAGSYDVWLIKTDSNGNEQWNKTWGTVSDDAAFGGQQTSDGGYILVGTYLTGQLWLIKSDSNGNEQWNKTYGGSSLDHGYFVQQTSDGGYIITGITQTYGAGGWDVWLIKTYSNGTEQWHNTFGGYISDGGVVGREIDDGYIITGWTYSYGPGARDCWLIKTDSNGNEQWNKTYGGPYDDLGHDVQLTSDGGYIIIGDTCSYGDNDHDFWLIKTDSYGNEQWNTTFGGRASTTVLNNFLYSSGMSVREIPDGYIMTGIGEAEPGGGVNDLLLLETDEYGNEQWNKTYGGFNIDEGYWFNVTSDGGYILCGATRSYGTGTIDGWLIKTDSNGNEQWNKTFPAPPNTPPNTPNTPNPEDGETNIKINVTLSWTGGDPDGDEVTYDVYFGTTSPPPQVNNNQSEETFNPGILFSNTKYYWQIIAWDCEGASASGPIWSFTTEKINQQPTTPTITGPEKGKPGNNLKYTITGTDPDGDMVSAYIKWGDDTITDWTAFHNSGESFTVTHAWTNKGTYSVQVKIKDEFDAESGWANLTVKIPMSFNLPNQFLYWFFERFPHAFPILRNLIGY